MEFLGKLGIDIKLLIAQMVNFGLLLWLLSKFLYKPIVRRIEKDEAELERAQIQSRELERQKKSFEKKKREEIIEAKKRAREIIKEAESIAEELKKRARREAEQEKQAVIRQIKTRLSEIEYAEKIKRQNEK